MEITGQRLVQRTGKFVSKRAVLKISLKKYNNFYYYYCVDLYIYMYWIGGQPV
jgi:hypothetical protein